jgi:hypothetical protein
MRKLIAFLAKFLFGGIKTFDEFLEAIQKEEVVSVTITVRNICSFPQFPAPPKGRIAYDIYMEATTAKGATIAFIDDTSCLWSYINSKREKTNDEKVIAEARKYAARIEEVTKGISVAIFHEEKPSKLDILNVAN